MASGSKGPTRGRPRGSRSGTKASRHAALTAWREARQLSQTALAEALGYSQTHISKLESNGSVPTRRLADRFLEKFPGTDTQQLCARWRQS